MTTSPMEQPNAPILHFYRGLVGHTDMWRQRLDTTTNWAVVATVGVISFSFSSTDTPHFVLLMLLVANSFFLLMESRRYQLYDLWQTRLDILHRYFFAPSMTGYRDVDEEQANAKIRELGFNLGETVPRMSIIDALGFRIRRHYIYIFLVTLGAWLLKMHITPASPVSVGEYINRASVGLLSAHLVLLLVALFSAVAVLLAARAPSEYLVHWTEQSSPLERLLGFRWFPNPTDVDPTSIYPGGGRSAGGSRSSIDGT